MSYVTEEINNEYNLLKEKLIELHYEEQNLGIQFDSDPDFEEHYEVFENYLKLW